MNAQNIPFYEKVGPDGLKEFGSVISIDDCIDLVKIEDLIKNSQHILEVGAGYGRVLNYLSRKHPDKFLTALENTDSMLNSLNQKYVGLANIIQGSVVDFKIDFSKPDLVLWMWSGFGDLSLEEQELALKNLYENSSETTTLVIDLPDVLKTVESGKKGRIGNFNHKNIVTINHPIFGFYQGYFPSIEEMHDLVLSSRFHMDKPNKYDLNDSPRIQYLLKK